jgi:hypothetical protein
MTIWKYDLPIRDEGHAVGWDGAYRLTMPVGARPLSVGVQAGKAVMWALVDEDAPLALKTFSIVATGRPAPSRAESRFIGTLELAGGGIILHFFEQAS